ncbi:hypothetical protein PFISCL1PPCAC_12681, partial [Pristionchus fissidentatus]
SSNSRDNRRGGGVKHRLVSSPPQMRRARLAVAHASGGFCCAHLRPIVGRRGEKDAVSSPLDTIQVWMRPAPEITRRCDRVATTGLRLCADRDRPNRCDDRPFETARRPLDPARLLPSFPRRDDRPHLVLRFQL